MTCVTGLFPAFQRLRVPPSSGTFSPKTILRWLNPDEGSILLLLLQVLQLQSLNVLTFSTYDFHLLQSWMQLKPAPEKILLQNPKKQWPDCPKYDDL